MTRDEYRPTTIPPDGRPRRLDAGWFASWVVDAADRDAAIVQAKIAARRARLSWTDVVSVVQGDSVPSSTVRWSWTVELMVEAPDDGRIGI